MSAIGPELPPHLLAKRKRRDQDAAAPSPEAQPSAHNDRDEKRRRVIGPAMPPAPLNERPSEPAEDVESSSDDDDDEFGPSLAADAPGKPSDGDDTAASNETALTPRDETQSKPKRDEWMTMAPTQDDLSARMDPSRLRARGFNTGRSARGGGRSAGGNEDAAAWHETAEQKQKRLADEVLGISTNKSTPDIKAHAKATDKAARAAKQDKTRGPSLLDQHRQQKPEQAEEDDPSKRAFDYEKDMAIGASSAQKRDMLHKATGYSSRFSGGSYL